MRLLIAFSKVAATAVLLQTFLMVDRAVAVSLVPRTHEGSFVRVKTVVELAGSLSVSNPVKATEESNNEIQIPLKVDAEMFFDQAGLAGDRSPVLRHYWDAKAEIELNKVSDHRELRKTRKLILSANGITANDRFTSPSGPLLREEVELIDIAGNGFPPERLLATKSVDVGQTWDHSDNVAAELLRISRVKTGTLSSKVVEITDEVVKIEIQGDVSGLVSGVKTKIDVKGNYHFDRSKKIVKWLALAIREERDSGFAAPGFEVVSRIRTVRESIPRSDALTQSVLQKNNLQPTDSDRLLEFVAEDDSYQMAIDRRWYLLSANKLTATLRMVDDGDLLATCKVDQLTKTVPGKQVTLDGFREDVQKALDKNCKEIVSASQTVNAQGVRVLRVVAAGEVAETPIRWIYCHLSDDDGRRLSFIFTHEASLESRFAGTDQAMTSSVKFLPQQRDIKQASKQNSQDDRK